MEKECVICGNKFETIKYGHTRKYCFTCSPPYKRGIRAECLKSIRKAVKQQLVNYRGGKCEICGYKECLPVLQFHHLDKEKKEFEICANLNASKFNMQDLYTEVDKCQLLCANCHGEIHSSEN